MKEWKINSENYSWTVVNVKVSDFKLEPGMLIEVCFCNEPGMSTYDQYQYFLVGDINDAGGFCSCCHFSCEPDNVVTRYTRLELK